MKTNEARIRKVLRNLLSALWVKAWVFLFFGILFITSDVKAEEHGNTNIKIVDYSKYDYEGVCDFILARFQEAETELADAQKQQIKLILVSKLSDNNIIRKYEYTGEYSKVKFVVTNSKQIISEATLNFAYLHKNYSKEYILTRLGINNEDAYDAIEIGCDALTAQLFFDRSELKKVVVKSDFIN